MIEAAVAGMGGEEGVLAVTVLTSLDDDDLREVGVGRALAPQVEVLAGLAAEHGAEGVVCSPHEARLVKTVDSGLLTVTPGIRPDDVSSQDQKRVTTPRQAISVGADLLVIGRAITSAADPAAAAASIAAGLSGEPER